MPRQFTASPLSVLSAEDTNGALFVLPDRRGEGGRQREEELKKKVREKLVCSYLPPEVLLNCSRKSVGKKAN